MILRFLRKIIPRPLLGPYHFILSFLAAFFYGFPSKKLRVIGVTGTNGKSTTVLLITHILEEAGYPVASSSSISFSVRGKERENAMRMTMPGRFSLQKFFREAVSEGCTHAVVEVTSEGIAQHRHRFISFDTAVFTNLSPEHIESHGGFDNYRKAKEKLFRSCRKTHVINLDDEHAHVFLSHEAERKIGYTLSRADSPEAEHVLSAQNVRTDQEKSSFSVQGTEFSLPLPGLFNVSNALAASGAALAQGVDLALCARALGNVSGIPGRMEKVADTPFPVYVDYAFTPNALQKVYETLAQEKRQLVCVLGAAGGGRDKWKRSILGKIAAEHCREVIVTNEDPYEEDPRQIMEQVATGAAGKARIIEDRREAIRQALSLATSHDTVVITGKGSEPSLCVKGGKKIPWDDRSVVREELSVMEN